MAFWDLRYPPDSVALIDCNGHPHSYAELARAADDASTMLDRYPSREVGFLLFELTPQAIALYLGALRGRRQVPLLLQPGMNPALIETLVDIYAPAWIACAPDSPVHRNYSLDHDFGGYALFARNGEERFAAPHADCGLLLSTSGSTGSPKLVRLAYTAISSNADAIATYLGLTAEDRAITTLPLAYSFGMSILNSHLAAGGCLTLTPHSPLTREFWAPAVAHDITSLSGVPSTFEMLRRIGPEKQGLRCLRMLTQAGGRLSEPLTRHFATLARECGWQFFVMYGQTEAAPRMSYVPPSRLPEKTGSIGIPIPGGSLEVDPASAELIYRGPNVMMGYARTREDLAGPDECEGVLRTGDLARADDEGYFYLTGRMKRFVKLSGSRINLDEVETALGKALATTVACVGEDDNMTVVMTTEVQADDSWVRGFLRELFDIYPGLVSVRRVAALPQLANGKIDYRVIEAMAANR
jgi:long-chain acyl-CoA synthetase